MAHALCTQQDQESLTRAMQAAANTSLIKTCCARQTVSSSCNCTLLHRNRFAGDTNTNIERTNNLPQHNQHPASVVTSATASTAADYHLQQYHHTQATTSCLVRDVLRQVEVDIVAREQQLSRPLLRLASACSAAAAELPPLRQT
jgi:hypothetical protein